MKKQTKIAAVLSAAAFMAMVSGLPVYAASHGLPKVTRRSTMTRTGISPLMPGGSAEMTGSISARTDRS